MKTAPHLPAAILLIAASLFAGPAGSISGIVRDPSGGIVTQAVITIASSASGAVRNTRPDPDGVFEFREIPPGKWSLTIDAAGFTRYEIPEVAVEVGHTARFDIHLQVGERTDAIQVRASPALPEIDRPGNKTVIVPEAIANLPLNGRQYLDLAILTPEAIPAAPGTQGSGFSVAGIRSQSNVYLLDGISNIDTQTNQPLNLFRIADAVQEFVVESGTTLPEFGRGAGAQVNVVTRSGTNSLHGSVFEYLRTTQLTAADFFTNKLNGPKNALHRNEFGATAGGAVRRDRTFFFASYEGFRQTAPAVSSTLVPTAAQRATVTDPISQRLLALFPLPNTNAALNYLANVRSLDSDDTGLLRLDHRVSGRDQLMARWTQYWGSSTVAGPTPLTGGNNGPLSQVSAELSESHVFSPAFLNETRLGFSRYLNNRVVQDSGFDSGTIFTAADGTPLPGVPRNSGLPSVTIGGGFAALGSNANFPQGRVSNTTEIFDDVSRGASRHTMRWGAHIRREDLARFLNRSERGSVNFANFADFARGQITTSTLRTGSTQAYWRRYPWDVYFEDQYRLRPNLTLNFGLRYEYPSAIGELQSHATNFVPGYGPMIAGTNLVVDIDPALRGAAAIVYRQAPFRLPASGIYAPSHNLAPMFGFGWSPFGDGKTAIRGGARIAYDDLFNNVPSSMALAAPYNLQTTQTANVTQPAKFAWPLAFNQNVPLVSNAGAQGPGTPTTGILTFQGIDPRMRSAQAYLYHLAIEHRSSWVVLEADYLASSGRHLGIFADVNQPEVIVRDPSKRGPLAPNEQIFPYPLFGQSQIAKSIGNSNYQGMLLVARRPLRHGLLLQASYTLGKSLDYNSSYFGSGNLTGETGAPIDARNLRLEHAPSAFDVRQRVAAYFTADLPAPFGQSRTARALAGGWTVSAIVTVQSGMPFTIVTGGPDASGFNQSTSGISPDGGNRPMLVKTGPLPQSNGNPDAAFDPSWFTSNLAGQDGTSGRNAYYGPALANTNLTLAKSVPIPMRREHARASFRADFFNLFNHTNFANPVADLSNASFGRVTQTLGSAVATSIGTSGGPTGGPRIIQLSLRLEF